MSSTDDDVQVVFDSKMDNSLDNSQDEAQQEAHQEVQQEAQKETQQEVQQEAHQEAQQETQQDAHQEAHNQLQVALPVAVPTIPLWIPGAETVDLIHDMLILKDETIQYMRLHYNPREKFPDFPWFYPANVYWIYVKACFKRCQPIYLNCLGDVIVQRVNDMFPTSRGVLTAPSLNDILLDYSNFNMASAKLNPHHYQWIFNRFEHILGESFRYLKGYHEMYRKSPPPPKFVVAFLSIYHFGGFHEMPGTSAEQYMERLQRNLRAIDPNVFTTTEQNFRANCRIIDRLRGVVP